MPGGVGFVLILGFMAFTLFWTSKFVQEVYNAPNNKTLGVTNIVAVENTTKLFLPGEFKEVMLVGTAIFALHVITRPLREHIMKKMNMLASDDYIQDFQEDLFFPEYGIFNDSTTQF